jgi:hypothetical protein
MRGKWLPIVFFDFDLLLLFLFLHRADVGHCFKHFVKMVPHCEMDTLIGTCDPSELEYWDTVCKSWGAKTAQCFAAVPLQ